LTDRLLHNASVTLSTFIRKWWTLLKYASA